MDFYAALMIFFFISIHALRGEGDTPPRSVKLNFALAFQSTPSVGRATAKNSKFLPHPTISIHALRGEGDGVCRFGNAIKNGFQSTPSVGRATNASRRISSSSSRFQSTPSVGRATKS